MTLSPGKRLSDIEMKLPSHGVVTGRVVDEDGEPLERIGVQLLRLERRNGKRVPVPVNRDSTDDRGHYRIFGVAPGKYYVCASAHEYFSAPAVRTDKYDHLAYPPTYYPNALSIAEAALIEVGSGAELNGTDLRLVKAHSFKISGRIADEKTRQYTYVQLVPIDEDGGGGREQMSQTTVDEKGNFTLRGLRSGRYRLEAHVELSGGGSMSGSADITVADSDIEGVQLPLLSNLEIAGRVRMESPSEAVKLPKGLGLQRADESVFSVALNEDGTFTARGIPRERLRLIAVPPPEGCYLKSVQLERREQDNMLLDLSEGISGELLVILSPKAAAVSGTAKERDGSVATRGMVILVPEDRTRTELYYASRPDQRGAYAMGSISPGSYKIFAFDNPGWDYLHDPNWLKPYESKGEAIELRESDRVTKEVNLIVTDEPEDDS